MSKKENKELHNILHKIRNEIIQNLSSNKIKNITTYHIRVTDITKSFTVTLKAGNTKLQDSIVDVLERNFGADLKYGKSSDGKKVLISVTEPYFKKFTEEQTKVKTPVAPEIDSKSTAGRKTTEFGNFRNAVTAYIESATKLVAGEKRGFYVLTDINKAGVKNLDIRCSEFSIVVRILSALEKEENYMKRIVSFERKKIKISRNPQSSEVVSARQSLLKYIERIENESAHVKYSIHALRNSSATVGATNLEEISLEFVVEDFEKSLKLSKLLNQEFRIRKQGKLLKVIGTYEQFLKELDKKSLLGTETAASEIIISDSEKKSIAQEPDKRRGKGLVYRENKEGLNSYVHMSQNYNDFNFLHFNRKVETRHVMEIVESIRRHGVLSFVNVVVTDCIDGVKQMYIVDGQHRFEAFRYLGYPILYTVVEASDKKEIVRLIADLNKTSRRWSTRNFMTAWSSLKIDDYTEIDTALTNTKLPITLILEVFSERDRSSATKLFQDGDFEIVNREKNKVILNDINLLKEHVPRSRELFSCLASAMRKIENYALDKVIQVLTGDKIRNLRAMSPGREKIISGIVKEYNRIAA